MQYKNTTKIIIDKRKLDVLIRLGCSESIIWEHIKTGKLVKTGDDLIDENLETFMDIKEFSNWGGKRLNSGNKKKKVNQDEKQVDNHLDNQDSNHLADIDKDKDIDNNISRKFKKPSLEEVEAYCIERGRGVDANKWYNYYSSNGWKVGRNQMKDWRAAVRTWERNYKQDSEEDNNGVKEFFAKYGI